MFARHLRRALVLAPAALMAGCSAVVLQPSGDVALQQRNLIIASTVLMLVVILPVIALTLFFAWKYRESNKDADYRPEWHHSTSLELVIWSAPLLIIIMLGALTWIATHTLDPYRRIDRIHAGQGVEKDAKRLRVQVVAMDWKWLFIYPDQGIATVNELAAPIDTPLDFQITSSTVMNAFYIPALAGQIYAMPGMETQLHAVINAPGDYEGFSANYSGAGFSDMRFRFHGLSHEDFEKWVAQVKTAPDGLKAEDYLKLEKPSIKEPARRYASVAGGLFDRVRGMCVDQNKMCLHDMMALDQKGGLGKGSAFNVSRLSYDGDRAREFDGRRSEYVTALCAPGDTDEAKAETDAVPMSPVPTDSPQPAGAGSARLLPR